MNAEDWKQMKPEIIVLSPEDHAEFVRQLDDPPKPTKALIDLLRRRPIWKE